MADTSLSEKKIGLLIWLSSNLWQSQLRKVLYKYNLSLNEYILIESLVYLEKKNKSISQKELSIFSGIDVSVISVCLKVLIKKEIIQRKSNEDNRKKIIFLLSKGKNLFEKIFPNIESIENDLFDKLANEKDNFKNSLKLLLGKKIRIKVNKL
tara:strand:+ start:9187 stop:9645 length:459 start_codon:yes stop_codon:yes gene_type:complete